MQNLSRRSLMLTGAAASLAAGSLAAEAAQAPSFPAEYHECCNRWIDYERWRLLRVLATIDDEADPNFAVEREADREAMAPYLEAKARLFARPVRTIYDVVALLRLAWWENGQFIRVGEWEAGSDEAKTLKAVEPLVGGPWQVPEDLIRLEAEYRVRREAAEEAARARRRNIVRVDFATGYVYKDGDEKLWMDRGSDL
jgi:hypothetical protein